MKDPFPATPIALRDYHAGDWEAMHELDVACFPPPFRFTRKTMRSFAEAPQAISVLAEAGKQLVGFCVVHLEGSTGYIVTLDVAEGWRRQGLARHLVTHAENRVRTSGGTAMTLHVFPGNEGAVQFYQAIGYKRLGTVEAFYGRGLDALAYGKWLDG